MSYRGSSNNRNMEEQGLPTIRDMYNCTRENHDYNVIRKHQGPHKNFAVGSKPTKKDHYLDHEIRLNCSPGPASTANQQTAWTRKNPFQSRRAEKLTYLDEIQHREKKNNSPSPNHYPLPMPWPKKRDQLKNVSEKTNFADTCQYESDLIPGPGNYNVCTHLGDSKGEAKPHDPHLPIHPKEVNAAEVGTYHPCPLEYNTFDRYLLRKSQTQPVLQKKGKKDNRSKENRSPGPAAYSTISHWAGKSPSKKKEANYLKVLSKSPSMRVYN